MRVKFDESYGLVNRRKFIKLAGRGFAGALVAGGVYSAVEAKCIETTRVSITVPNLAPVFHGKTVAFLSDFHHSIVVPGSYIKHVVEVTNALSPDIVVLGGDYVTKSENYMWMHGESYIEPCFEILRHLKAKLGVYAVAGNHDTHAGLPRVRAAIKASGFCDLINRGGWLTIQGERLRLCGVGDYRTFYSDVKAALDDATENEAVILVSHNPDVAEDRVYDNRVGLMLAGHTHGGQIVLPFVGAPAVSFCSSYGQKYRYGLVRGPKCNVLVTSGVGTLPPAFRLNCPPEVMLITLVSPMV